MSLASSIPAVVSKRNEFTPADEFVENSMPYLPKEYQHVNFRAWLLKYTEEVIKGVASHFGLAAERGIAQAAELLCDPEFYETRKQRRAKQRRQWEEEKTKQEWDRIEQTMCPTAEQIEKQIKWAEQNLAYHESQAEKSRQRLNTLRSTTPRNIRLVPKGIQ